MLRRVYWWYVTAHRDIKYETKLRNAQYKRQESGITVIGLPMAILGAISGRQAGRNLRRFRDEFRLDPGWLVGHVGRMVSGPGCYAVCLASLLVLLGLARPFLGEDLFSTLAGLAFVVAAIPVGHVHYLARRDVKTALRLERAAEAPSADDAADTFAHLESRQPQIRRNATAVTAAICRETPGKFVKYVGGDHEAVIERLVPLVDDTNPDVRIQALWSLKWLARDYGEALVPHAKALADAVESPHSTAQAHATIALGNVGATERDRERIDAYAKAITPAVEDPDNEVRHAAAVALGMLRCRRTVALLEHLSEDTDPAVRERATESLADLRG